MNGYLQLSKHLIIHSKIVLNLKLVLQSTKTKQVETCNPKYYMKMKYQRPNKLKLVIQGT